MTPPKLCGDCGAQMEVNPDLFAMPGMDPTPNGLAFNFTRGLPVTVYICPNCGRFKFISAIFLNNTGSATDERSSGDERSSAQPQPAAVDAAKET